MSSATRPWRNLGANSGIGPGPMLAVVPVRAGQLPAGAEEAVAEAGGSGVLVGTGTEQSAAQLIGATELWCAELGDFAPAAWAVALVSHVAERDVLVLPASPDGRDLAPRLAHSLGRRLLAGAISVTPALVVLARRGGLVAEYHQVDGPVVSTLQPGVRGVESAGSAPVVTRLDVGLLPSAPDAELVELLAPNPATMDLAEAPRIIAGGGGLGGSEAFEILRCVARALGASYGASRVASDAGWAPQDRFIGTTGVTVGAELYVAIGISGAVQHVAGLGQPEHVIAVNTDASAPMMSLADLALVTDGRALLRELADRLGVARE